MSDNSTLIEQLDALWRQVRAKPYRFDETVEQVLALPLALTEVSARDLLTHEHSPTDRLAREAVALENYRRQEARAVLRVRPGQVVHHVDGDPRNNDLSNLRLVDDPSENVRRTES